VFNEANDLIRRMSCKPCASAWMAFLGACKIHGHVKLRKEHLIQTYAMPLGKFLSITYISAGVWNFNAYTNNQYCVHEEPVTPGLKYIFVIDR